MTDCLQPPEVFIIIFELLLGVLVIFSIVFGLWWLTTTTLNQTSTGNNPSNKDDSDKSD